MGDVIIREAREADVEALTRLMNELGYVTSLEDMKLRFAKISSHPFHDTLVAERGDKVVGMVGMEVGHQYGKNEDHARIDVLVVDARHRNRGIGRALAEAAENRARRWGVRSMVLDSSVERAEAHRFYASLGYEATGYRFSRSLESLAAREDRGGRGQPARRFRGALAKVSLYSLWGLLLVMGLLVLVASISAGDVGWLGWLLPIFVVAVPLFFLTRRNAPSRERGPLWPYRSEERKDGERELLDALREREALTPTMAAMLTTLSATEAADLLKGLARRGYLETRAQGGFLVYTLRDQNRRWLEEPAAMPGAAPATMPAENEHQAPSSEVPAQAPLDEPLSEREREVLRLLATGRSNREIAQDLFVAPGTVKAHINNIYRKLGARNRAEALAKARDLGLSG